MEKRISLNKIPKSQKDRIIKIRPRAIALIEVEELNVNQDKAPKWFEEFATEVKTFINKQEKFNETISNRIDKLDARMDKIDTRINKLEEYHK